MWSWKFNSWFVGSSKPGPASLSGRGTIVILVVGILGVAALFLIYIYAVHQVRERNALQLGHELIDVRSRLALGMQQRVHAVEMLRGFMLATRKLPDFSEFDNFSASLVALTPAAKGYAFIDPDGVIRHFYPLAGNEKAIGLDIYSRPGAPFLRKAVAERRTTVGDPLRIVQGELAVVIRTPLFRDGSLIGIVQGVFDISKLVEQVEDSMPPGMTLRLEDARGQIFHGEDLDLAWSGSFPVPVGGNLWRLQVAWKAGPPDTPWLMVMLIWFGGGLLLASLLYILYSIQSQARVLARAVDERTASLHESQRVLSTLMANLPGMVYRCKNDKDWTMEFISEGCFALTGYTADDFVTRRTVTYGLLIHPEDQEPVWDQVQAGIREKQPFQLLYRITTAQGEEKWVWEQGRGVFSPEGELLVLEGFITDTTERQRAAQELAKSEARFQPLVNSALNAIVVLAPDHRILEFNPEAERVFGVKRDDVIGKDYFKLFLPSDAWMAVDDEMKNILAGGVTRGFETIVKTANASERLMLWNASRVDDAAGNPLGVLTVGHDVTADRLAEEKIQQSEQLLRTVMETLPVGVWIADASGKLVTSNTAGRAIWSGAKYVGIENNGEYKGWWADTGKPIAPEDWPLARAIRKGETSINEVIEIECFDGARKTIFNSAVPLRKNNTEIAGAIVVNQDITEMIQVQARLQFLAHHDALTDLPNRALFLERLDHALSRAHWTKRSLAVLFLDMDRFKNINDTLGHNIGDSALNVIAQRLLGCVRDGDTVARLGGDEYTVLLEDMASTDDVPAIAQKIIDVLSQPFMAEGREFIITASLGISLYPSDGEDSGTLLRHADTAMYRAKEQGRNKYQFYSAEMGAKALEKFTLETSLRHALERNEFILYYQPQVSLTTGRIIGVEALVRWRHPELGLLQPLQFIPLAEETGLMQSIDEWVMETACAQAKVWQSARHIPLSLIVNLSSRTFSEPRLVEKVASILSQTGLAPGLLELEITENIVMEHASETVDRLTVLNRMGIKLAIDDFGTGYSSLSYLKRFPLDTLKIDKSFVNDITTDEDDAAIATAIIAMGKSLQLRVVAEGVETKGQLTFLREQECDGMQGYLFCRPVMADEITSMLKSGNKLF